MSSSEEALRKRREKFGTPGTSITINNPPPLPPKDSNDVKSKSNYQQQPQQGNNKYPHPSQPGSLGPQPAPNHHHGGGGSNYHTKGGGFTSSSVRIGAGGGAYASQQHDTHRGRGNTQSSLSQQQGQVPPRHDGPAFYDHREGFDVGGKWRSKSGTGDGGGNNPYRHHQQQQPPKFAAACSIWEKTGQCNKFDCKFRHEARNAEDQAITRKEEAMKSYRPLTPEQERKGGDDRHKTHDRRRSPSRDHRHRGRSYSPRRRDDHRRVDHHRRDERRGRSRGTHHHHQDRDRHERRKVPELGRSMSKVFRPEDDKKGGKHTNAPRTASGGGGGGGGGPQPQTNVKPKFQRPLPIPRPVDRLEYPEDPFAVHENPSRGVAMPIQKQLDDAPSYRLAVASSVGSSTPLGIDPSLKGDIPYRRLLSLEEMAKPIKSMEDLTALHKLELARTLIEEENMDKARLSLRNSTMVGKHKSHSSQPPWIAARERTSKKAHAYLDQVKVAKETGTDPRAIPRPSGVSTIGTCFPQYIPWLKKVNRDLGDHKATIPATPGTVDEDGNPVAEVPNPSPTAVHRIMPMLAERRLAMAEWATFEEQEKQQQQQQKAAAAAAAAAEPLGKTEADESIAAHEEAPATKRQKKEE